MPPSATKNTSDVTTQFWADGQAAIQQKAKSMSQQYLDSKSSSPVPDDSSLAGISSWLEKMTNQASSRADALYDKQKADATQWAKDSRAASWNDSVQKFEQQQALNQSKGGGGGSIGNGGSYGGSSGSSGGVPSWIDYKYPTFQNDLERNLIRERGRAEQNVVRQQGSNAIALAGANNNFQSSESMYSRIFSREQSDLDRAFNERQSAATRASQEKLSASELASAERRAAIDAQSRVYSSMFGAFGGGGGNNNYQYWGGQV